MKSCLKLSPPLTPPFGSVSGSPIASGSASPTCGNTPLPLCRKTVSFCQDLEECFEADDWDRTPAPVAPKLSYQDILELKQIMRDLPRAPQRCRYSQQSTTFVPQISAPTPPPSSCSSAPFPVARLAAAPSLTPSRWKNREASRDLDPEILPYLESVPIQLLPLLPPSSETSQSSTPLTTSPPPQPSSAAAPAEPIKPPISAPLPMCILTPPPSLDSSTSSSPATSPASSSPSTPRRTANFSFVPLLPVKEEFKAPAPAPVTAPPPPMRKFNMTFVPLLPPEPEPVVIHSNPAPEPVELTPQNETPPEEEHSSHTEDESDTHSPPPRYIPLNLAHVSRSYTSTPSLSSASDTDTESETPSVSSPCPSSPIVDEEAVSHYFASHATIPAEAFEAELLQRSADVGSASLASNHNPYFPAIPPPSHSSYSTEIPAMIAAKKVQLQALPSPVLQPPSPFSLYPSEPVEDNSSSSSAGVLDGTLPMGKRALHAKRSFVQRPSALSAIDLRLGESSPGMSPELTIELMRNKPMTKVDAVMGQNVLVSSFSRRG